MKIEVLMKKKNKKEGKLTVGTVISEGRLPNQ